MSEKRERRKAVVRGVPLGGKEWDFWFGVEGVHVHCKWNNHKKDLVVPWQHVVTGAGLEVEAGGRVFRAALRRDGLSLCEVRNRARTKVLPWPKLVWEAYVTDDSVMQPSLFMGVPS